MLRAFICSLMRLHANLESLPGGRQTAHNRRNRCAPGRSELLNMLLVSMRLRDDDRSPTVLVPLPSVLDFA